MAFKILKKLDNAAIAEKGHHKVYFGPFQFDIDIDLSKPEIELKCKIFNFMTFDCKLDNGVFDFDRKINLLVFSCDFECEADFKKDHELRCTITPCLLKKLCKKLDLILLKW